MLVKEIKIKPLNYKEQYATYVIPSQEYEGELDGYDVFGEFSGLSALHFFDSEGTQLLVTMDEFEPTQKVRTFTLSNGKKGSIECDTIYDNKYYMHALGSVIRIDEPTQLPINPIQKGTFHGFCGNLNPVGRGDFLLVKFDEPVDLSQIAFTSRDNNYKVYSQEQHKENLARMKGSVAEQSRFVMGYGGRYCAIGGMMDDKKYNTDYEYEVYVNSQKQEIERLIEAPFSITANLGADEQSPEIDEPQDEPVAPKETLKIKVVKQNGKYFYLPKRS